MRKDFGGRVRLHTPHAELDGDVTNLFLDEGRERLHLRELGRGRLRDLLHLLADFGGGVAASVGDADVPDAQVFPALEAALLAIRRLQ